LAAPQEARYQTRLARLADDRLREIALFTRMPSSNTDFELREADRHREWKWSAARALPNCEAL